MVSPLVYELWVQWTKKYNDNLFQAIEFYNGLPSPNEMKTSDVFVKKKTHLSEEKKHP